MNTEKINHSKFEESENGSLESAEHWERPANPEGETKDNSSLIRLELNPAKKGERKKGRLANAFLLRGEEEPEVDSNENLKAKRQQFKALFEAGIKR